MAIRNRTIKQILPADGYFIEVSGKDDQGPFIERYDVLMWALVEWEREDNVFFSTIDSVVVGFDGERPQLWEDLWDGLILEERYKNAKVSIENS